jgi:hypothetical protein
VYIVPSDKLKSALPPPVPGFNPVMIRSDPSTELIMRTIPLNDFPFESTTFTCKKGGALVGSQTGIRLTMIKEDELVVMSGVSGVAGLVVDVRLGVRVIFSNDMDEVARIGRGETDDIKG